MYHDVYKLIEASKSTHLINVCRKIITITPSQFHDLYGNTKHCMTLTTLMKQVENPKYIDAQKKSHF
jgi:hypothetical protein